MIPMAWLNLSCQYWDEPRLLSGETIDKVDDVEIAEEFASSSFVSMTAAALSNLSYCIISTLSLVDVIPTFLAALLIPSLETHLFQIFARITMKASRFKVLKSVNIDAFSFFILLVDVLV